MTRVLYSFPHKIGADRICLIAWSQVAGLAEAGASVTACPGAVHRPLPEAVTVRPTLQFGKARIPYRLLGMERACAWHDARVARWLTALADRIDVVHCWPMGALRTLRVAKRLGIPSVLERPNAHTAFAYEAVRQECARLDLEMPKGHDHEYNEVRLRIEEEEYALADRLLCPSDFVARTFRERGFADAKLARHQYGFDEASFRPSAEPRDPKRPFTMLFAGECTPRKGLHYALEAWHASPARRAGRFLIAGGFMPGYRERLAPLLAHPSVEVLGFRRDVPDLMRASDVFVLPSVEEGSALVTSEARGCGCVLLVSDASGAPCTHDHDALVHAAGDVEVLTRHLTALYDDRARLAAMRAASLATVRDLTWSVAGRRLLQVYRDVIASRPRPGR